MLSFYSNVTRNTERFVAKTGLDAVRIEDGIPDDCILVMPTYGRAAVPVQVLKALSTRAERAKIRGIVGTGNLNFGSNFCAGAYKLAERLNVPMLLTVELAGTAHDVERLLEVYANHYKELAHA